MDLRGCDRQIRGSALQCLAARIKLMTDDRICGLCSDCHLYENTALGTVAIASTVAHGRCLHIALKITTHTHTQIYVYIYILFKSKYSLCAVHGPAAAGRGFIFCISKMQTTSETKRNENNIFAKYKRISRSQTKGILLQPGHATLAESPAFPLIYYSVPLIDLQRSLLAA